MTPSSRHSGARNARRPDRARPRNRHCATFASWALGEDGEFITPEDLPKFGTERHRLRQGARGARRQPRLVRREAEQGRRRAGPAAASLAIVGGVIALIAGLNIPFSGLTLIGVGAIAGGIVVIGFAQAMPAVTMSGAMVRAMMAAYRRTLQKTMAQARSMDQVVAEAGLDWLDTPDQAVVWGTALGLQSEIEGVLSRSLEDVQQGRRRGARALLPDLVPELERHAVHGLGRRAAAAAASSRTRASPTSAG